MHALAVVLGEAEVERGERRDRAGDADRARGLTAGRQERPDVRGDRVDVLAELLRQAHRADVDALVPVAEDELGRPAADVEDQRVRRDLADAASRQRRFLVAG